ncbi:MAG: 50S ribosomal protein L25 [bacterium]|nr:50S ribosomal protein L25 [bacterium]
MEPITITAQKREQLGKHVAKIRKEDNLPGVLYGHETKSQPLQVNAKEFGKIFKKAGESTIVSLVLDGKTRPVLIHDVQNHYLNGEPIHVDFYAVNMNEKLKAKVVLHFIGESSAVKTMGGVLIKNMSEVEVECLPADLPASFEIDISKLINFDEGIRISDIEVSDKVKILAKPEELITIVTAPRTEAELAELEAAPVAEDVSAVEGVADKEEGEEGEAAEGKKEDKAEASDQKAPEAKSESSSKDQK